MSEIFLKNLITNNIDKRENIVIIRISHFFTTTAVMIPAWNSSEILLSVVGSILSSTHILSFTSYTKIWKPRSWIFSFVSSCAIFEMYCIILGWHCIFLSYFNSCIVTEGKSVSIYNFRALWDMQRFVTSF